MTTAVVCVCVCHLLTYSFAAIRTLIHAVSIHIIAEEKITSISDQDGGLESFEVKGDLSFRIADPNQARFQLYLAGADEKTFQFRVCTVSH
jgi:hypothetical protein